MEEAARWWLASAAIGAAGLVPSALLFGGLRSAGVLLARPLGLALLSLGGWWVGWSGLLPYGTGALLLVLAAIAAGGAAAAWRRPELRRAIASRWRLLLAGEALFLAIFLALALARAQAPDAAGTEKPMDLMLLTAIHRAGALPPPDPWLAGETLSYHYLGHLAVDASGRLAGAGPRIAFNLGLAQAGAMAGAAIFGLAGDMLALSAVRRRASVWVAGAAAAVALLWTAPAAGLFDLAAASRGGGGIDPGRALGEWWWWWDATRVLTGPIAEFPAFSLLLGDLHAHVLALPLAAAAAALALGAFGGEDRPGWRRWLRRPERLLLAGALFAALSMTNAWDVLTYGLLWFGAAAIALRRAGGSWLRAVPGAAVALAPPAAAALAFAAPFLASLDSAPAGIALVTTEATGLRSWLLIWAAPLLPLAAAAALLRPGARVLDALGGAELALGAVAAWALAQALGGHGDALGQRGGGGWLLLALLAAAIGVAGAAAARADARRDRALAAWLALAAGVAVLTFAAELVNVETGQGGRFNTVFKLWYHLWMLAALAAGAAAAMAVDRVEWRALLPRPAPPWRLAALALAVAAAALYAATWLYAPAMALSRGREGQASGLDAIAWLERSDPGLAGAVAFARAELDPARHVLLQAEGDPYSMEGYLASASAVPTVLGWLNHQQNWRGPEGLIERREDVARIYGLGAAAETERLVAAYGVTHVYLGREERRRYGPDVAARFGGWPVVFESSGARIVAVPAGSGR